MSSFLFSAAFAALLFSCDQKPDGPVVIPPVPADGPVATVYTTSSKERFTESTLPLGKPEDVHFYKVERSGETFQEVDGFGLAITQASCYNLKLMPRDARDAFLTEVFSREKGLGSSLIRVCIGGSDFSMDEFTWCDEPGMENFAVHPLDEEWLFPVLDEIFRINPAVKIIASPWSCPRWMKVSDSGGFFDEWRGGRLNPAYYQEYADYFVRWIREMEVRGYPIYAVTLQNEPLNEWNNSMSLYMTWQEQRDFIKQAVGPAFRAAELKTKILLFDHNYNYDGIASQQDYPIRILQDSEAAQFVAGSAWHSYGGNVSTLDKVHGAFPDKDIYFTEASIGSWGYSFDGCLINDFRDVILGTLGRYGKGVTLWNLMLDDEGKPYRPGGCEKCFGAVTLSSSDHRTITRNSHYYNVAHCSKVLQPGAVRLGTKGYETAGLTYQWYRNPDGSQALLLLNEGSSDALVNFVTEKHSISCKIPAKAIQSIRWEE
jgi:glucosylceramidase